MPHQRDLADLVEREVRAVASCWLRRGGPGQILQTTAVINEAFVRILSSTERPESREHLVRLAVVAVRHVLVDEARRRSAAKRSPSGNRVPLDAAALEVGREAVDVLELNDCLERLRELHERQAQVVELRFFGGMKDEQIAETLGVGLSTVTRDWRWARAWLRRELMAAEPSEASK